MILAVERTTVQVVVHFHSGSSNRGEVCHASHVDVSRQHSVDVEILFVHLLGKPAQLVGRTNLVDTVYGSHEVGLRGAADRALVAGETMCRLCCVVGVARRLRTAAQRINSLCGEGIGRCVNTEFLTPSQLVSDGTAGQLLGRRSTATYRLTIVLEVGLCEVCVSIVEVVAVVCARQVAGNHTAAVATCRTLGLGYYQAVDSHVRTVRPTHDTGKVGCRLAGELTCEEAVGDGAAGVALTYDTGAAAAAALGATDSSIGVAVVHQTIKVEGDGCHVVERRCDGTAYAQILHSAKHFVEERCIYSLRVSAFESHSHLMTLAIKSTVERRVTNLNRVGRVVDVVQQNGIGISLSSIHQCCKFSQFICSTDLIDAIHLGKRPRICSSQTQ